MNGGRYLVLTELFLPTKGGTAVWFDAVYRRLGGKATHIITADVPGAAEYDRGHPNTVHRLRLARHAWLRPASLPVYARLFAKGLALGLRHPFDAVHAGRVLPEGYVARLLARLLRRPLVIYAHGEEITGWRHPRRQRAMAATYRAADIVIANSDFTRDALIERGVDPERIEIIHPGVDLERFRPDYPTADLRRGLAIGEDQPLILSVGRLNLRKGFDQVIRMLPQLVRQGLDVHYAIAGIGEAEPDLKRLAAEQGVTDRVHFLGPVPAEDLPRWYCAADVFAMPNREIDGDTEGFGMVFVEAAACGTPALAGIAGGTGSAVADGVTGLRVDGTDTQAIAEALSRLLGDRELAARLAASARERACRELAWERVAERTAALHAEPATEVQG
ncbi:glycosyltransferase family 4 protein [Spiribacter halobius]|uniref:Glycosyl transferase n=1 Tax=Sediminicurvatus halobius TaxID=2182432 RepID=A0A2U2N0T4_9GAMM|nr:glycosyltransferase family 4 protein [Spiribacter halobius]PWG62672.1 glycosyl transferase [Spiribacter halobius]UEX77341.1 glycosyltransferase family 4 protein [Spiribacter halobius]